MSLFPIADVAKYGLITDVDPSTLPLNAWSSGKNVHFSGGAAGKVTGYRSLFGGATVAPYFIFPAASLSGDVYWVYAGATAVYTYELLGLGVGTHHNITRTAGAYTAAAAFDWQGGTLNGLPILNNGTDVPQVWNPVAETTPLVDLPNWPANTTAKILRSYKNFLVALDVTKAGVRDYHLVKWSHAAAAGAVPTSWDEADPTLDAGEYSLADTPGELVDCLPLGDANILYKTDSIWSMQSVPGSGIFKFSKLFGGVGALSKNCMVEYQTGKHLVLARDDIFVHDGQTITSIGYNKYNEQLFQLIDPNYAKRSFVVTDPQHKEVWICYPETGQSLPSAAIVWNWQTGTFGHRELPLVASISSRLIGTVGMDAWNLDNSTWQAPGVWAEQDVSPASSHLLMAKPSDLTLLGVLGSAENFAGVDESVELVRTGLGLPFRAAEAPDIASMKFCTRVWPRLTGQTGTQVQVTFGTQMSAHEAPTWGTAQTFTIGTTTHLDVRASGRLFAIKFASTTVGMWALQGYDLDAVFVGEF